MKRPKSGATATSDHPSQSTLILQLFHLQSCARFRKRQCASRTKPSLPWTPQLLDSAKSKKKRLRAPVSAGFQRRTSCASGCGAPRCGCARAAGPPGLWSWAGRCCPHSLWAASTRRRPRLRRPRRLRRLRRRLWRPEPPGRRRVARYIHNTTMKQAIFPFQSLELVARVRRQFQKKSTK